MGHKKWYDIPDLDNRRKYHDELISRINLLSKENIASLLKTVILMKTDSGLNMKLDCP